MVESSKTVLGQARKFMRNWISVLGAFATTGVFIGWLVGASNSPVVYALLPLLFGLIGGFSFSRIENRAQEDSYRSKLIGLTDDTETQEKISKALGLDQKVEWVPAFWAASIMLFVGAAFVGISMGIDFRQGSTSTLSEVLERNNFAASDVDAEERLALQNALFQLRAYGMDDVEIDDVFSGTLLPFVKNDSLYLDDSYEGYGGTFDEKISSLFENLSKPVLTGRGPASNP